MSPREKIFIPLDTIGSPEAISNPEIDDPHDKCGVVGVIQFAPMGKIARIAYKMLNAVQKRGYDAAGILSSNGGRFVGKVGPDKVSDVYPDEGELHDKCFSSDYIAVGQNRYGTMEDDNPAEDKESYQPVKDSKREKILAHNGAIPNAKLVALRYNRPIKHGVSDTVIAADAIFAQAEEKGSLYEAACEVAPQLDGAFTFVMSDGKELIAMRDPRGTRPLSIGLLPGGKGYVVSSETISFDSASSLVSGGITFLRDVMPGEIVRFSKEHGMRSEFFAEPEEQELCGLEIAYVMNMRSKLMNGTIVVEDLRQKELGHQLALEHPVEDPENSVVIPVPETGIPAARGYAEAQGIEVIEPVKKIQDIRTFLRATQQNRKAGIREKFNIDLGILKSLSGKKIYIVDDSGFRGNTAIGLGEMLREAYEELDMEAPEIHWRFPYPKVVNKCDRGIALGKVKELIARKSAEDGTFLGIREDEDIARDMHASSVGYISVEGFAGRLKRKIGGICMRCIKPPVTIETQELAERELVGAAA